jgi:4-aminobutyrate aminotransferase-like enzyme
MFANEGLPSLPPGWLAKAEAALRAQGALIIADEVQPGFGRSGSHFWGHDRLGFRPDIVTMGKPMGNGHPVAGVATTPPIMAAFRGAFSYFNTFGGNPVSFFGAEIVTDRATKAPAPAYVARVANEMRRRGVLLNRLGIHYNTLKIRPPMPFSIANADHLLGLLDEVLGELGAPDA